MILKVHTRGMPLAADVDLKETAASTPGLVGADLRNLVNEAALLAARRNQESIRQLDVLDALETLVLGPARALVMSKDERTRIASEPVNLGETGRRANYSVSNTSCGLLIQAGPGSGGGKGSWRTKRSGCAA
jgi:SpoVK/Ycf46/Vps4 family AAA+-type ATPase